MVKPIPDEYPRLSPYLIVDDGAAAIDFYVKVLGARERGGRFIGPDGKIGHAELAVGDSVLMLADEHREMGALSPKTIGGSPITLTVYVEDVDAAFERATSAGATALEPVEDKFYGDRAGQFVDPFGHRWNVQTHVEDVPPDEMQRRAKAMMGG